MIHTLPQSFQRILADPELLTSLRGRTIEVQDLRLQIEEIYASYSIMSSSTGIMAQSFLGDCYYGEHPDRNPWIADITDFSSILCFGHDSGHGPFCLDYRSGTPDPQVIYFDGIGWRVIANSFDDFEQLLLRAA